MKHLIVLLTLLLVPLTGLALQEPNWETGEGCWRYGVLENGNTGKLTNYESVLDIPVVKGEHGVCDGRRACYVSGPREQIVLLKWHSGKMELYHERCAALLGTKHNNCKGYGIGKDESACDWDL